jgi:hypothetical protein
MVSHTKLGINILKTLCWSAIVFLSLCASAYGVFIYEWYYAGGLAHSPGWCGNMVTDPLDLMLSIGTPISFAGTIILGSLWRRNMAGGSSVAVALGLSLAFTIALFIFGHYYFRYSIPNYHLTDSIWWLKPLCWLRI